MQDLKNSQQPTTCKSRAPFHSWNYIWSHFMHKPRVRNWLFWRESPGITHLAHSLTNGPMLNGFIFTAHADQQFKNFPDIGDLETVFTLDNDVILGFTFGYRGVNPVVPIASTFSNDSYLADPSYAVRRTARQLIKFGDLICYIHLELAWMKTDYLVAKSSVQGLHYISGHSFEPGSVMDEVEMRIFSPDQTRILVEHAELLNYNYGASQVPPQSQVQTLSSGIESPRCSLIVRVREPVEIGRQRSFKNTVIGNSEQVKPASRTIFTSSHAASHHTSPTEHFLGTASTAENLTMNNAVIQSWNQLCQFIGDSRLQGNYRSTISRVEGKHGCGELLMQQDSDFLFLVSKGRLTLRRIHHLCSLLGIDYTRPDIDNSLFAPAAFEVDHEANSSDIHISKSKYTETVMNSDKLSYPKSISMSEREALRDPNDANDSYDCFDLGADDDRIFVPEESFIDTLGTGGTGKRRRVAVPEDDGEDPAGSDHDDQAEEMHRGQVSVPPSEPHTVLTSKEPDGHFEATRSLDGSSERSTLDEDDIFDPKSDTCRKKSTKECESVSAAEGRKISGSGPNEVWECGICGASIKGKRGNLKRHIEFKHYNIRRFECSHPGCGRKFHNRLNLKRHEDAVHEGRPFKCFECPRDFKNQQDLDIHFRKSHYGRTEKLACDICGGCFGYKSSLYRHRRTVHGQDSVVNVIESQSREPR